MNSCGLHCLKIENINVNLSGRDVVENVSVHAHCGELTAIIGNNGTGKSTLLKALLGEVSYTGRIIFSGHSGEKVAKKPKIGYVPQHLVRDEQSPITVFDMLQAFTSKYPVFLPARKKDVKFLKEHLKKFNADHLLNSSLGKLSGGELQRVLLANAMLPKPDLLVLDEPVSGVDQEGLTVFYDLIDDMKKTEDIVILLVSHDLNYVAKNADHVVLLSREGEASGAPEKVFSTNEFKKAFPKAFETITFR